LTAEKINPFNTTPRWARSTKVNPVEYRVSYGARTCKGGCGNVEMQQVNTVYADTETLVIEKLSPFTKYRVSVLDDRTHFPSSRISVTTHMQNNEASHHVKDGVVPDQKAFDLY